MSVHIDVDSFLDRMPTNNYNCFDFVAEVCASMGRDIKEEFPWLGTAFKDRHALVSNLRSFKRIDIPVDGCFVVFQQKRWVPHIGIYYRGEVLHLAHTGAALAKLKSVSRRYLKVGFYQ